MKKKSNQTAADTAASAPATRLPPAATATTVTTSSSATFVLGQLDRHGSRIAAPASGTTTAAAIAARSLVT